MKRSLLYLIPFFLLVSCDEVWECLININPEIDQKTIQPAILDQNYSQFITAHVKNDVNDDFYEYFFDVLGPLPEGLDIWFDYRRIEIYGIPRETGVYRLTVSVSIGAYDDGDYYDPNPTCDGFTERTFILRVEEH